MQQWLGSLWSWTGLTTKWAPTVPTAQPIVEIVVEEKELEEDPQSPSSLPINPFPCDSPKVSLRVEPEAKCDSPIVDMVPSSESLLAEASDQCISMMTKSTPKKKVIIKDAVHIKAAESTKKAVKKTTTKPKKQTTTKSTKKNSRKVTAKKTKKVKGKKVKTTKIVKKAAKKARKRKFAEMERDIPTIPVSQSVTVSPKKKRAKKSKVAAEKVIEKIYGERIVPGTTSQTEYLVKYHGVRKSDASWQKSDDSLMFNAVLAQFRVDMKNPSRKKYMKTVCRQIASKQQSK